MMEQCDNDDALIDFSSENDSLIAPATSSSTLTSALNDLHLSETQDDNKCFEFLGDMNSDKKVNEVNKVVINGHTEELPQLIRTSEPDQKPKNGRCNMRKSLAWDRAFFTSSGVLDAEELTSMIEGTEKSKRQVLTGIEEDMSRSTDSFSTLDSENLTIESLEADLFQDIRASIQRSSKATNMAFSSGKVTSQDSDTHSLSYLKKIDPNSRTRLKPKTTSKATSNSVPRSEKTTKPASGAHTIQSVGRIRESASALPRPPLPISGVRNPNRLSTSTSKVFSSTNNHARTGTESTKDSTGGSKGTVPSKQIGLTGPRRLVPKPAPPSKPPTALKNDLTRTLSCDTSSSASSNNSLKILPRRKIDQPPKTFSKIPPRNKNLAEKSNSVLSAHVKLADLPSSISPASSVISEWSSASSSPTSTIDRRSKSRVSIETNSSCRSTESDAAVLRASTESDSNCQTVKKSSAPAGTTSRQPSAKPSGLRMPSPKIGFFDGAKSASRTPKSGVQAQSRLATGLARTGQSVPANSPIGISSNKSKTGNATKLASSLSVSNEVSKGESNPEEIGIIVKDQESVVSIDSFSCINIDVKQQAVEEQKAAKRAPFTDKNSTFSTEPIDISRDSSADLVEKTTALESDDIGLKENC